MVGSKISQVFSISISCSKYETLKFSRLRLCFKNSCFLALKNTSSHSVNKNCAVLGLMSRLCEVIFQRSLCIEYKKTSRLLAFLILIGGLYSCNEQISGVRRGKGNILNMEKEMQVKTENCRFKKVRMNINEKNSCSPKIDTPGLGLIINAPKKVKFKKGKLVDEFGAFAAIPICGYYNVEVVIGKEEPMKLVAVNRLTKEVYSGDIIVLDESPIVPPPKREPLKPEDVAGMTVGGYINPNLANFVKIPDESAVYDVHIEFRNRKSNSVTIELIEKKGLF